MLDIEAILSSRSPVASMHPISTRITEMILIEVIFSLNVKYSIINTKTGAVLSKTAARDNGTVFIELLFKNLFNNYYNYYNINLSPVYIVHIR